jgi:PAS domain S-box-containing protein
MLGDALGAVLGNGAVVLLAALLLALALRPVSRLAGLATAVAAGARTPVPYTDRRDEVGSLARSLVRWRQAEASRRAIVEHSPVGLFTLGPDLAIADVNPALRALFAVPAEGVSFSSLDVFVHPDGRDATQELGRRLLSGASDHERMEERFVRTGGHGVFWGSLTVAVVRGRDRAPQRYVCMIEDVTEQRERLERAASVQRDLLPETAPDLDGYELAGLCRPSRQMSGDFYDWQHQEPGGLAVTLGDVSGKDMPAALLMAILRIALRTGAARAPAGETVRSVAAATARYLERAGAFVRLFHGRLDLASGVLTYVDAGHGLALIVGEAGARRLPRTGALPLGVVEGPDYREETARLECGEALVLLSDGVLEVHPELETRLEAVAELVAGAGSAGEMTERLASAAGAPADDVTVLVLRRKDDRAVATRRTTGAARRAAPGRAHRPRGASFPG